MDIQIVLTSPQTAALQTCLDIFGSRSDVDIHIEPLLHPRINCTSNIPARNDDLISKFTREPFKGKIENADWFIQYGSSDINQ